MKLGNQIIAGAFLVLGLFYVVQAPQYQLSTVDAGAGPGLLPLLTGAALALSSISLFGLAQKNEPAALDDGIVPERLGMIRLGGVIVALIAVVVLMPKLGFRLTMFAFLAFTIRLLGRFNPFLIIAVALGGSVGLFWLFNDRLLVILPRGPNGF